MSAPLVGRGRRARARLTALDTTSTAAGPSPVAAGLSRAGQVASRLRNRQRRQRQLPEALERVATALRAGSSLTQALGAAARATAPPLGVELTKVARETEQGRPLLEVLDRWVAGHDDRATRLAATALTLAALLGAAPARALDGVASTLRERQEVGDERQALATQAKASAAVLSIAPVGFALLLGVSDRATAAFLFGSRPGWICLILGVGLDAGGAVWMAHLVRGREGQR